MTAMLPADPETERLAKEVARATGKPVSAIVCDTIAASARDAGVQIARQPRLSAIEKRRRLLQVSERSAARPILDPRTADEIVGYNERGFPR